MTIPVLSSWAVVHDIDGCFILGIDGKPTFGTTVLARYNDIDARAILDEAFAKGLLTEEMAHKFIGQTGRGISTPEDIAALGDWALYDTGLITRDDLVAVKAMVNRGLSEEAMYRAIEEIRFTPYAKEFASYVRTKGGKQLVVTDGWDPVALYVAERLGLDYAEGNKPIFEGGRFTGRVERIKKEEVIASKLREYGVGNSEVVGIDDANTFITSYGLAVAFCPKDTKRFAGYSNVVVVREPSYKPVLEATRNWLLGKGVL